MADSPPSTSGYGTQIFLPEYDPNKVFKELGIPLSFQLDLADTITDEADLLHRLQAIEAEDSDALLCFNHGVIRGKFEPNSGHVVVFDRTANGLVRLVDASWKQPKWRLVSPGLLLDAIRQHGNKNSGGIWRFSKLAHLDTSLT